MSNSYQFTEDYVVRVSSDGNFSIIPRHMLPKMLLDSLWIEWERLRDTKARLEKEYREGDEPPDEKTYMEEMEKLNENIFLVRKQLDNMKEVEKRENEKWGDI